MPYVDFLGPGATALSWLTSKYGFKLVESHSENSHDYLIYLADSTGVRVTLDRLEDRVVIEVAQVEDGRPVALSLPGGKSQTWFGQNLIAELRGAAAISTVGVGAIDQPNIVASEQAALAQAAESLRTFGSAILEGDRSSFPDLVKLVGRKHGRNR